MQTDMSGVPDPVPSSPSRSDGLRSVGAVPRVLPQCLLLVGLAGAILLAAAYAYHLAKSFEWLRTNCLIAILVACLGVPLCLAGVIRYVNIFLDAEPRRWYIRWPFFHLKQVLLLAQIITTALAVAAAIFLVFPFKIP